MSDRKKTCNLLLKPKMIREINRDKLSTPELSVPIKFRSIYLFRLCLVLTVFVFTVLCSSSSFAEPFFSDTFESGTLTLSENGFKWASPNRTSIVRDDQYVVWPNFIGPIEGREWENGPGIEGRHSLRFRYPAGEPMAEQRLNLGGAYPEIWISYWFRVPINYIHGTLDRPQGHRNQKFGAFWTDVYASNTEPTVIFEMWDQADAWNESETEGATKVRFSVHPHATTTFTVAQYWYENFICFPADQGRWMHVVLRLKLSSHEGAADGVVQWWRRWSDETEYALIGHYKDIDWSITEGKNAGWNAGYLMGWANGYYTETTEFLIDDFTVSESSLLVVGSALKPPTGLTILENDSVSQPN